MDITELREELAGAGKRHSGHVTHGSLDAMMLVVTDAITKALAKRDCVLPESCTFVGCRADSVEFERCLAHQRGDTVREQSRQ